MTVPIYAVLDTWNAGATTFTGIGINVTDTASAAASMLLDLQVGSASKFSVRKDGVLTTPFRVGAATYSAAGTTQGTATPLTTDICVVTSASADQGVVLPAGLAGKRITIHNRTTSRIKVYPASGESFAGQSTFTANLPAYIIEGGSAIVTCEADGVWSSPYLSQGALYFGIGGMVSTGSGGADVTTRVVNPTGSAILAVTDTMVVVGGTGATVNGGLTLYQGTGLHLFTATQQQAQIVTTSTPDLNLKVAATSGGSYLTVNRLKSSASAVNNLVMTNSATGNGIKLEAEGTDTNIDMIINPKGTGNVQLGGGSWAANGSVATVLGSVGPTGANTTVQEWFAVKNASGVVRYIPGF